jgi:hypothetical protein
VRQAGADDAGDQGDEGRVDESLAIEARAVGHPFGEMGGDEEADDHHQAIAVDRDGRADVKPFLKKLGEGDSEKFLEHGIRAPAGES